MAWLTNWNRRKPIIINGSTTGAQTNYQMQLTVYKSTGTDTPGNIYLGTNIRDDFGDVRFTKSDGSSLLNYWIESYTSGVSAIVWIQIDSIPVSPSSSTIYIYYDNSSQVTASNGAQTFDFFGDALNKFTTQGSIWSLSGTTLKLDASVHSWKYAYTPPFQIPYVVETTVTTDTGNLVGEMPTGIIVGYSGTGSGSEDGMYVAKGGRNLFTNGAFHSGSDTSSVLGKAKVVVKSTTNVITYWNDVLITDYTSRNIVNNRGVGIVKYYAGIGEFTNFRVRKYVSPEPTWSCSGGEEVYTISWLTGWNRRKSKIVNGSTYGTQTNYQMKLAVHKTIGVDTSTDIYLGTNVRNDFGDVRFAKPDGSTLLNYWIDPSSLISGISTDIWIQIDSIPASPCTSTIYIYYDNSSQTSISNGSTTFDFFDDFDGSSLDTTTKWTVNTGDQSVSGGELSAGTSGATYIRSKTSFPINRAIRSRVKVVVAGASDSAYVGFADGTGRPVAGETPNIALGYTYSSMTAGFSNVANSISTFNHDPITYSDRSIYNIDDVLRISTTSVIYKQNDVTLKTTTTYIPTIDLPLVIGRVNAGTVKYDWILVRRYVSPEPTWSCSGIEEPSTVSWLTGWNRRKYVTINGSTAGAQTNYQMQVTVYKSSGTDSGNTVYLGINVKDDFSDIRFTRNDGVTLLNYWIDPSSIISGTSATVLIQVDSIPLSPCTGKIYLYYNNASASSISNGATFILFDDFNDGNYDGWTAVSGQWSAVLGFLRAGTSGAQEIKIPSNTAYGAWEWKFRTNGFGNSEMFFKIMSAGNGISNNQYAHRVNPLSSAYFEIRRDVGGLSYPVDSSWTADTNWHKIKITRNQNGLFELFLDDTSKGTGTDNTITATSSLAIFTEGIQNYDFDDIRIRRYITPEPTFGIWSVEESITCNVPSCNLIILEILSEQLSRTYPEYIDLEIVSKFLDDFKDMI